MKKIGLTQGRIALVDDEDYEWINQWKWYYHRGTKAKTGYAIRSIETKEGKRYSIRMHRIIKKLGLKIEDNRNIDHKDRDGLNNQRSNLRICNDGENSRNSVKDTNTSGYRGVSWHSIGKKWRAFIKLNDKYIHLGLFVDIKEAAKAYNEAAIKYHKDYAILNQV